MVVQFRSFLQCFCALGEVIAHAHTEVCTAFLSTLHQCVTAIGRLRIGEYTEIRLFFEGGVCFFWKLEVFGNRMRVHIHNEVPANKSAPAGSREGEGVPTWGTECGGLGLGGIKAGGGLGAITRVVVVGNRLADLQDFHGHVDVGLLRVAVWPCDLHGDHRCGVLIVDRVDDESASLSCKGCGDKGQLDA